MTQPPDRRAARPSGGPAAGAMPDWSRRADAFSRSWTRVLALIGLLGLLAITLATVLDVSLRALFARPIHGLSDLYELAVIIMVAACFPASLAGRRQVAIRFLGKVLPWRAREALETLGHALTLAVFAVTAWTLIGYCADLIETNQTTWMLAIPMWPSWAIATALVALCVPVEALVLAIQIRRLVNPVEPGPGEVGGAGDHEGVPDDAEEFGAI